MKQYVLYAYGSCYDEIFFKILYTGTSLMKATNLIIDREFKQLQNGGHIYYYLETWKNDEKIFSKEFE